MTTPRVITNVRGCLSEPEARRVITALVGAHHIHPDEGPCHAGKLLAALTGGGGTAVGYDHSDGQGGMFTHLIVRPPSDEHDVRLYRTQESWNAFHIPNDGRQAFSRGAIEHASGGVSYNFWGSDKAFEFGPSVTPGAFNLVVHTNLVEIDLAPLLSHAEADPQ